MTRRNYGLDTVVHSKAILDFISHLQNLILEYPDPHDYRLQAFGVRVPKDVSELVVLQFRPIAKYFAQGNLFLRSGSAMDSEAFHEHLIIAFEHLSKMHYDEAPTLPITHTRSEYRKRYRYDQIPQAANDLFQWVDHGYLPIGLSAKEPA